MPRNGTKNLIPLSQRTTEERKEIAARAGKASGVARRKKSDIKKAMQYLLDSSYQVMDGSGEYKSLSGADVIAKAIMKNASNPNSKNWRSAVEFAFLCVKKKDPKENLEQKKIKMEIALLEAKLKAISSADTTVLDTLDEILESVRETAEKESQASEESEDEAEIIEETE